MQEPQQPSLGALVEGKPAQEKPPLVEGTPAYLEAVKRTRNTWIAMRYRCRDPRCNGYHNYGGRGITVCDRWQEFKNFVADMGLRPQGTEIDRIDVDGNYEPGNCRWIPRALNARTARRVVIPFVDGESKSQRNLKVYRHWLQRNKERRRKQLSTWYENNKERKRAKFSEWLKKNREHRRKYARERYHKRKAAALNKTS